MKKRKSACIFAMAILATILSGCGGADKKAASGTESSGETQKRTLSFLNWRTEDKAVYEKLIGQFEAENPGITVEMEIIPSGDYDQALYMRTQGGEANDVFTCQPGGELMKNAETGILMDLSKCEGIMSHYTSDGLAAGQVEGVQYGVVQTTNPLAIYYNKDIFKEYGLSVPKTVEDFMKVCEVLKSKEITPMAFGAGETWMTQFFIESLVANNCKNTDIFSDVDKGKAKLADEKGIGDLINICREIYEKGYILEGSSGVQEESLLTGFAVGNYAMISTGTWSMSTIRSINPECDFGVFNMPGTLGTDKGVSNTGAILCINNNSKVKEDAVKFVEFLTSPEALEILCNETGQLTVVEGVKIEGEDLKAAQALLQTKDGYISAPYHGITSETQKACYGFCTQILTEKVDDTDALIEEWQKAIDNTK